MARRRPSRATASATTSTALVPVKRGTKKRPLRVGVKGSEGYPILIVPLVVVGGVGYLVFRGGKYLLTGK